MSSMVATMAPIWSERSPSDEIAWAFSFVPLSTETDSINRVLDDFKAFLGRVSCLLGTLSGKVAVTGDVIAGSSHLFTGSRYRACLGSNLFGTGGHMISSTVQLDSSRSEAGGCVYDAGYGVGYFFDKLVESMGCLGQFILAFYLKALAKISLTGGDISQAIDHVIKGALHDSPEKNQQ